ncbi:carbonic anhydrase [Streptomyces sp. NPDC048507]|uniref:carbonic anhydrase n=1 Tax=Streptomyces sp. NPDC048507 TaxID=3365560 RepID=UPI003715F55E
MATDDRGLSEPSELPGLPCRRRLVRAALTGTAAVAAGLVSGTRPAPPAARPGAAALRPASPASALRELVRGNARWRTLHESHPDRTRAVRRRLVAGQHPFAVVLGCIDSRVPPELVFDQGLGDLLTVRSAGSVLDEAVLAGVTFGVLELGIPLVVVLAHQSCGAVTAAVAADEEGEELPGHMQYLAEQIHPAIDHGLSGPARVDAAITTHARRVRTRLAADPALTPRITAGRLSLVAARYELTTQRVHTL